MDSILVNEEKCPKNHVCPLITKCPVNAITQKDAFSAPIIDNDKCIACGVCVKLCGYGAFVYKG